MWLEVWVLHTLSIMLAKGDGEFEEANLVKTGRFPHYRTYGDWNSDGNLDLAVVVAGEESVEVYEGDGLGNFKMLSRHETGVNPHGLTNADFNKDGNLDLAVSNRTSGGITIFMGKGNGNFKNTSSIYTGHDGIAIENGDFDGDGKIDLAMVSASSHSLLFYREMVKEGSIPGNHLFIKFFSIFLNFSFLFQVI